MGLPKELEESARLDGCNIGQTFYESYVTFTKSGLVALEYLQHYLHLKILCGR